MKWLLWLFILFSMPAFGTLTVTGTCTGTTSCTLSANNPGDLVIAWAYRAGSLTAPTEPAAFTNLAFSSTSSSNTSSRSWKGGCQVATSTTAVASGTWTNATNMAMVAISGTGATSTANCATDAVGTLGTPNSPTTNATVTYSALTLGASSSTPLLLMGSSTSAQTCVPATGTSKAATGDILIGIANATGNWSAGTCTITSSVWTTIVIEIKAETVLAACSVSCPALAQYDQPGSNAGGQPLKGIDGSATLSFKHFIHMLPQKTLANNLLACFLAYDGTTTTVSSFTIDGTAFTGVGTASNDGNKVIRWYYIAGIAAGKQNIDLQLSANAFDEELVCGEFYNVATTTPLDVNSNTSCSTGCTGPFVQPGSITPNVTDDLILVAGANDAGGNTLTFGHETNLYSAPGTNYTLLSGANARFGPFAYFIDYGSTTAINPGMRAYQATADTWGIAAAAFKKSAGAGTAPTGMYIAHRWAEEPGLVTNVIQLPATGNLEVITGSTDPLAQSYASNVNADSDSNTWQRTTGAFNTTGQPQIIYSDGVVHAGYVSTNPNTRKVTITMSSTTTPDPLMIFDVVGASSPAYDSTMGTVTSGSQSQTTFSTGTTDGTACQNNASFNTTLSGTPSTAGGIIFVTENNGQGPECAFGGSSGTQDSNHVFDAVFFPGEDDQCCGALNSSSGYAHIFYSSATSQTATFWWANGPTNGLSGSPGSSYVMSMAAFKAPVVAATPAPKLLMMNVGNEQ